MGATGGPTWSVSEASRLVRLSRRDTQRCFYDGKDGGHLPPHGPRSWGKADYDVHDLAVLFLVAQARRRGLSFAKATKETRERLQGAGLEELLAEEAEAAADKAWELIERLAYAEALGAALGNREERVARLRAARGRAAALEAPLKGEAWDASTPTPAQELLGQLLEAAEREQAREV